MVMKKQILKTLPLLLVPVLSFSQITKERDVVGSAGNHSSTAAMELSWTVGEPVVNYSENPTLIVSEGFQQGDQGSVGLTGDAFAGEISVYPNPVSHELYYEIQSDQELKLIGGLYDEYGRMVIEINQFIVNDKYKGQLDLRPLSPGKMILRFSTESGEFQKTFNILKIE